MNKLIICIGLLISSLLISCNDDSSVEVEPVVNVEQKSDTSKVVQEETLEEINKQIVDNPGSSNGFYRRSKYHSKKGDFNSALDDIDRALQIDPEVDFLLLERGKLLMSSGRLSDAALYAMRAIEVNEEYFEAHVVLGKLLYVTGDNKQAIVHLDKALQLDKFNYEPYFIKGLLFESTGVVNDTIAAATSYQTAIEQNPDHFDSYFKLAALYYKRKPQLAVQYLIQAIEVDPYSLEALRSLSSLQVDLQDYEGSLNTISKMISTDPGYSESYFLKGRTYIMMLADDASQQTIDTTYYQAISFLDKATELYPDYDMAYYLKGLCYQEIGEKGKARELFVSAIDINAKNELATQALRDLD